MSKGGWLGIAAAALTGAALGVGTFTFTYAKGASYLTDDPAACANCHVMRDQYDAWIKSSHRAVATCNDCHTPHNALGKYATKARNGFLHSAYFTLGGFPEPIRITPASRAVTEGTCRSCHQEIVTAIDPAGGTGHSGGSCLRCHGSVGHWTR
ncbi:MAG: cytochrome c nitrite reductase small subunit [Gemmatimonadales bacterium]